MAKTALVLGAGGFIGTALVERLNEEGYYVWGIDLKHPEFYNSTAHKFYIADLRKEVIKEIGFDFNEVYQLAADMGGAGYVFSGDHDADIIHNSAQINLNICEAFKNTKAKVFFSSSACVYPSYNQEDPLNPNCKESSAYPAAPDSEYGWEKLFSERLYQSYARNYGMNIRIARFHNIFGEYSTYKGGKEKAPAAICRKVAEAKDGDTIEIWGTGDQTRSFLYIDECIEGIRRLMNSDYKDPINIGSDQMISMNGLARMIIHISGKDLKIKNIPGPVGVNGRNSDNRLCESVLNWKPSQSLQSGMEKLYLWVEKEINKS